MRNAWWIIFILLALWQVIGSLAEKASKKQQEQRLRELAAQRKRQMDARRGPSREPAPPARTPADRAETLAARRRAQLEELRRRRATRQQPTAQAGRQPTPISFQPPASAPTSYQRAPTAGRAPATRPPAGPGRPTPTLVPATRPSRWERPVPREQPARRAEPRRVEPARAVKTTPVVEPRPRPSARSRALASIAAGERIGPALLRKLVAYREILDPPVALRERNVWERV